MRDIKFRAWDYDMNEWTTAFDMDNDGVVYPAQTPYSDNPDIRIMQYTGLTDKNGKEIYEGDIVAYPWVEGVPRKQWAKGQIVFDAPCFKNFHQGATQPTMMNTNIEYEVIGNIYENPGLLK